jgi:hypothetical protein
MAERDADRASPERMCGQAVRVFTSVADREISPGFRQRLTEYSTEPDLFGPAELVASAQTGLEVEIARNVANGNDRAGAISDALRRLGESYAREQSSQLIADRHPSASIASESFRNACNQAVPTVTAQILDGQSSPRTSSRVRLDENPLSPPASGGNV